MLLLLLFFRSSLLNKGEREKQKDAKKLEQHKKKTVYKRLVGFPFFLSPVKE